MTIQKILVTLLKENLWKLSIIYETLNSAISQQKILQWKVIDQ
jgi:hypothetical protein